MYDRVGLFATVYNDTTNTTPASGEKIFYVNFRGCDSSLFCPASQRKLYEGYVLYFRCTSTTRCTVQRIYKKSLFVQYYSSTSLQGIFLVGTQKNPNLQKNRNAFSLKSVSSQTRIIHTYVRSSTLYFFYGGSFQMRKKNSTSTLEVLNSQTDILVEY